MRLDSEKTWSVLERLQQGQRLGPDAESVRVAAVALAFIVGSGHSYDFEDYLACFEQGVSSDLFPSFDTQEQAQDWLRGPLDPRHEHGVRVAGTRYSVSYSLEQGVGFLVRVPTKAELTTVAPRGAGTRLEESLAVLCRACVHVTSSEDVEAVHVALLAIYFILESSQSHDFERFLTVFGSNAPISVLRSFATREEAQSWLNGHPRPPHGAQVEIAGQRFSIGYARDRDLRALVRVPSFEGQG